MKGSDESLVLIANHLWWLALMVKIGLAGSVLYLFFALIGGYEGGGTTL
tara:strand:- start:50 stop:196 length:147 start_codon:yes stop_codon:yes gene_type:complete